MIRSISKPLADIQQVMGVLAGGDLGMHVPHLAKRDEIGAMAHALNVFKESAIERARLEDAAKIKDAAAHNERRQFLHSLAMEFEQNIQSIIGSVASASSQLYQTADNMRVTVTALSSESTSTTQSSEITSGNVTSVSAATEEMSASIIEIAHQISRSGHLVEETVEKTKRADQATHLLSNAVTRINDILQMIQDIAEQINLLALNATIESARAGEAGRGFAVVAGEVKRLASQTTKATEEIAKHINGIQHVAADVVTVLQSIQTGISEVNEYSSGVASAVEEQTAVTREIAQNMQNASLGVQDISRNMKRIDMGVQQAGSVAREVLSAADLLSRDSSSLREQVNRFIAGIKAG